MRAMPNGTATIAAPRRLAALLRLATLLLLLAAPAAARKQNRAARQVNNRRRECEKSDKCMAEHEDYRHNCVLHCQSPACYEEVYGVEELEPGEVDHKRSGLFTRCMHAENRKAGSRTGSQPQPWKQGATVDASGQQRAV